VRLRGLASAVGRRARAKALSLLGAPQPFYFLPAPSVEAQTVRFRFRGKTFTVEAGHSSPLYETIAEVVDFDCYQLKQIEAQELLRGAIVDVGANIGVTALCFSEIAGRGVVCFEPVPENAARLRANLAANGVANVTVIESAISKVTGKISFWVPEHEDVGGRVTDVSGDGGRLLEVAGLDLETALSHVDGPIALLKVDCEGGEYDLLDQMTPRIVERVDALTFEIHDRGPGRNLAAASQSLRALGYGLSFRPDPFGREQLHHVLARR
jgi:FkbM family methyltransferase